MPAEFYIIINLVHLRKTVVDDLPARFIYETLRKSRIGQMRLLFTLLTFTISGQVWSQSIDNYVRTIEKLRIEGILTKKSSIERTFAGSVTAYYHRDSLVLINSLTDGENGGIETFYFIKDGILSKVFSMSFDSNDEWSGYYSKHKSLIKCHKCHGKPNCIVTEITLGERRAIVVTNKKRSELTQDKTAKMVAEYQWTIDQIKSILKEQE